MTEHNALIPTLSESPWGIVLGGDGFAYIGDPATQTLSKVELYPGAAAAAKAAAERGPEPVDEVAEAKVKAFLADLTELSRKHGLEISGCGHCGSPRVDPFEEGALVPGAGYVIDDNLVWETPDNEEAA